MKTFIKNNEKSLYFILAIFILMLLHIPSDKAVEYPLAATMIPDKNITEYSPALSLGKGTYTFTVSSNAQDSVELKVSSYTNPVLMTEFVSSGIKTFTLELDENLNGITLSTEGQKGVLTNLKVESDSILYTDTIYMAFIILIALLLVLWIKSSDASNEKTAVFIVLAAAVVASYPLMTSYVYFGHDVNFHLWRIEGIADGIRSGQFPVRIHPTHNNGYGYITASVYPELFMYFPALLRLIGVSLPTAYKSLIFVMNILTALIMYYSTKSITKSRFSATLASVIYTLATWRMMGLYARAALGEAFAMTFLPLVISGLYQVLKGDKSKWYILVIAYTCIFQVHVITTVLTAILSVVIALIFIRDCFKEKRWLAILKALGVTVLLNLWFLVPFMKYYFSLDMVIRNLGVNREFFDHAIIPAELFNIFNNGFGYSFLLPKGIKGNMSLSLGFTVSACLVLAVSYFIFNKKEELHEEKFTKGYFLCGLGFLFAATSIFPWELLQQNSILNKFAGLVGMPWRFLSVATPLIVLAAAHIAQKWVDSEKSKKITLFAVCAVCTIFMVHFGSPFTTGTSAALEKCQTPAVRDSIGLAKEYLVKGTDPDKLIAETYTASGGVKVEAFEKKGTNIKLEITNQTADGYVEVPLLYYPGYKVTDEDGNRLETVSGTNNVLRVNLGGSSGNLTIKYAGFIYFRIAELISLATLLLLIFGKKLKKGCLNREK